MKEVDENKISSDAGQMKRMNFSAEEEQSRENAIPASDSSRINERDQRIEKEQDTARLRSERQSAKDKEGQ